MEPGSERLDKDRVPLVSRFDVVAGLHLKKQPERDENEAHEMIVPVLVDLAGKSGFGPVDRRSRVRTRLPAARQGGSVLRRNGSCMAANSLNLRNLLPVLLSQLGLASGCQHPIPVMGHFQGTANVAAEANVRGEMAIKLPTSVDPGPMVASVIRPARGLPLAPGLP